MALRRLPASLTSILETTRIATHSLLSIDTNPVPGQWRHITKIDPENDKKLPLLYPLYLKHTDAISVGGSQNVTSRNSENTFQLLEHVRTPAFHEPSAARHVTSTTLDQAAFMAIPEVLNGDTESLIGTLGEGVEYIRDELAPELIGDKIPIDLGDRLGARLANFASYWLLHRAVFEAYIIQNPDSAAAREANVTDGDLLAPRVAKQRAMAAERHLGSEVIYLEYSGTFGADEAEAILNELTNGVTWARIWYGGGISTADQANQILEAGADAVIVGNVFHDIASTEATLLATARKALDESPSRETIADWVDTEVDLESTASRQYLSTIPSVDDPRKLARKYLTETTATWLELTRLTAIARDRDITTDQGLRDLIDESPAPTPSPENEVGLDPGYKESLQTAYIANHLGIDADPDLAVSKFPAANDTQ